MVCGVYICMNEYVYVCVCAYVCVCVCACLLVCAYACVLLFGAVVTCRELFGELVYGVSSDSASPIRGPGALHLALSLRLDGH